MKIKDITQHCQLCNSDYELARDEFGRLKLRCTNCGHEVIIEQYVGDISRKEEV